jgi:hypothetical protein
MVYISETKEMILLLLLCFVEILYIKATVVFVCLCGQCLEDYFSHCPFPVELPQMKLTPEKKEIRGSLIF